MHINENCDQYFLSVWMAEENHLSSDFGVFSVGTVCGIC